MSSETNIPESTESESPITLEVVYNMTKSNAEQISTLHTDMSSIHADVNNLVAVSNQESKSSLDEFFEFADSPVGVGLVGIASGVCLGVMLAAGVSGSTISEFAGSTIASMLKGRMH